MKTLYVKNKTILSTKLSQNGYLAYLGMLMVLRQNKTHYYVNTDYLAYLLSNQYPVNNNFKNHIRNVFYELSNLNLISIEKKNTSNKEWIVDTEKFIEHSKINKENKTKLNFYTSIDENDIYTILSITDSQYHKKYITLIRFYSYLLSTIHNKDDGYRGTGFTSISDMEITIGYNRKTISKYIQQLEELKLIFVFRSKDFIKYDNGDIVEISYTYGRFKDKDKVLHVGRTYENSYGEKTKAAHKKIRKQAGDKTRKYSQMYNHIKKCIDEGNDIKYTYSQIKKVYSVMVELNEKYKTDRPKRMKDLSVFSGYNFYNDE